MQYGNEWHEYLANISSLVIGFSPISEGQLLHIRSALIPDVIDHSLLVSTSGPCAIYHFKHHLFDHPGIHLANVSKEIEFPYYYLLHDASCLALSPSHLGVCDLLLPSGLRGNSVSFPLGLCTIVSATNWSSHLNLGLHRLSCKLICKMILWRPSQMPVVCVFIVCVESM